MAAKEKPSVSVELPKWEQIRARFPNFMKFMDTVQLDDRSISDPGIKKLVKSGRAYRPTKAQWDQFFEAAISDGMTNMRAFTLLGLTAKKKGISI